MGENKLEGFQEGYGRTDLSYIEEGDAIEVEWGGFVLMVGGKWGFGIISL